MRCSPATALLIAGLACASAIYADEAWRTKPPADWDQKDIRQILEHSAWAHRVSLVLVRPAGQVAGCVGSSGPCQRVDAFREPSTTKEPGTLPTPVASHQLSAQAESGELQGRYSGAASSNAPDGVAGVAVVRWVSSRTVREALAHLVSPSGKRLDAQDLAQLAPADAYVVYVDLRVALAEVSRVPQNGILTAQMAHHSSLVLKSTGERIAAARVAPAPLPEFDERKELALAAYYVFFPKQKNGRAVLAEHETEVRFECPLSPVPIRADFKLSRMERQGSPDF